MNKLYAVDKKLNLLVGEVLEFIPNQDNPDRVKIDRSWLYGPDDKKNHHNHILLVDVNLFELSEADFQLKVQQVRELWQLNMKVVMERYDKWKATWHINNPTN